MCFTLLTDAEVEAQLERFPNAVINDCMRITGEHIHRFREGEDFLKTPDPETYKKAVRRIPEFMSDSRVVGIRHMCKVFIGDMKRLRRYDFSLCDDRYFFYNAEETLERFYGKVPENLTIEDVWEVERKCKKLHRAMERVINPLSNPGRPHKTINQVYEDWLCRQWEAFYDKGMKILKPRYRGRYPLRQRLDDLSKFVKEISSDFSRSIDEIKLEELNYHFKKRKPLLKTIFAYIFGIRGNSKRKMKPESIGKAVDRLLANSTISPKSRTRTKIRV